MIRCSNCKSILVKSIDLNYAKVKKESDPAADSEVLPKYFQCESCSYAWFSDPEAQKLYLEYKKLVPKTSAVAEIVRPRGTYHVYHIKPDELSRRIELAKLLTENHQHDLDLEAGEWFEIIQDAK